MADDVLRPSARCPLANEQADPDWPAGAGRGHQHRFAFRQGGVGIGPGVQQRLDEHDALNEWTTPIGSSVFALPRGVTEGGWLGEELIQPTG